MRKSLILLLCLSGYCIAGPVTHKRNMEIVQQRDSDDATNETEKEMEAVAAASPSSPEMAIISKLTLPSNATSIRADITDSFSCDNRTYGYYADIENECQIFHVCLPVTYANGKESVYRWSFICPEETIFSQESFTCMRADDMTITCEESLQYYELNRNFGMVEPEADKRPSTQEIAEENEQKEIAATAIEMEAVPMPSKPQEEEEEKEIVQIEVKPVKVERPNRRKPAQKRPVNTYPLRKIPQMQFQSNINRVDELATETKKQEEQEVTKPSIVKFAKRPLSATQLKKTDTNSNIRTDLYNQKRKRPTVFNKKPIETIPDLIAENQENDKMPEDKMPESISMPETASAAPNAIADVEEQASENLSVVVAPEEIKENESETSAEANAESQEGQKEETKVNLVSAEDSQNEAAGQVLEAFEEIPAVIVEKEESMDKTQEQAVQDEQENLNKIAGAMTEDKETVDKVEFNENTQQSEMDAAETQSSDNEEIKQNEKTHEEAEAITPNEADPVAAEEPQLIKDLEIAEPSIFEENSEEGFVQNAEQPIEEMEAEKPDEAPESMSATVEMTQQDPIVQEMFEDNDANKQSLGGFKPVDPVMAAEAEQLIVDFINTLRKNDFTNEVPSMPSEMQENVAELLPMENSENLENDSMNINEQSEIPDKDNEIMPAENEKINEETSEKVEQTQMNIAETENANQNGIMVEEVSPVLKQLAPEAEIINENSADILETEVKQPEEISQDQIKVESMPEVSEAANMSSEIAETAASESSQDQNDNEEKSDINIKDSASDIFQIPVQVITAPVEEEIKVMPEAEESKPMENNFPINNEQMVDETSATLKDAHHPLSIDDIVELVKERLDHMPRDEIEKPMQLDQVLGAVQDSENKEENKLTETEEKTNMNEPEKSLSEEEIVMPIYHRTSEPIKVDAAVQTETDIKEENPTVEAESAPKEKSNRSYRSRSMLTPKLDARKRRFQFNSKSS